MRARCTGVCYEMQLAVALRDWAFLDDRLSVTTPRRDERTSR